MRINCTLSFGAQGIIRVFIVLTLVVPFPSQVYAVSVQQFSGFAENLNSGRFTLDEDVSVTGEAGSPVAPIIIGIAVGAAGGFIGTVAAHYAIRFIDSLLDPQDAFLFSEFSIGGTSIVNELITEALLPENVVFETILPDFLGGTTFTGTSAFSGNAFDADGNVIPAGNITIGFGVFQTISRGSLFSNIVFATTPSDFELIDSTDWDLSPVEQGLSGNFEARGLHLLAVESAPAPSTLPLVFVGLVSFVVYNRFCRRLSAG